MMRYARDQTWKSQYRLTATRFRGLGLSLLPRWKFLQYARLRGACPVLNFVRERGCFFYFTEYQIL